MQSIKKLPLYNFTTCDLSKIKYKGNPRSQKLGIIYKDTHYMVKFPTRKSLYLATYANSCISEHIGSQLFYFDRFFPKCK